MRLLSPVLPEEWAFVPASLTRYEFQSYDELRSIRRLDGGRRSVFGPDGRVAGSERLERFFFWRRFELDLAAQP
jgi:hypothetical protein